MQSNGLIVGGGYNGLRSRIERCGEPVHCASGGEMGGGALRRLLSAPRPLALLNWANLVGTSPPSKDGDKLPWKPNDKQAHYKVAMPGHV